MGRSDEQYGVETPYEFILEAGGKHHHFYVGTYLFIRDDHFEDLVGVPGMMHPSYYPFDLPIDWYFGLLNAEQVFGSEEDAESFLASFEDMKKLDGSWFYNASYTSNRVVSLELSTGFAGDLPTNPSDRQYQQIATDFASYLEDVIDDFKHLYQKRYEEWITEGGSIW